MDRGTVDRIEEWEARPFSGGYAGLHDLADAEFSGAVTDGTAWLFMLNGRVVGVFHGTVSTFEGAEGSAYEAPHPALVLLFAMRERGGETRAQYYTDDTPLSEVDGTLSEGSFTGYVELSENVLSGDYYVVYYGGRSMSVAFIGSSERVVTGDEAFERANDEVGIYEVKSVDLEVQDIPEPADEPEPEPDPEPADEPEPDPEPAGDPDPSDEPTPEPEPEPEPTSGTEAEPDPDPEPVDDPATAEPDAGVESGRTDDGEAADAPEPNPGPVADAGVEAQGTDQDPFSEEEEWRQTRTVPALDPEETEVETEREESTTGGTDERERPDSAEAAVQSGEEDTRDGAVEDRIVELETALESREDEIEQLQERVESVIAERDRLEEERDRLEERVERLESGSGSTGSTAGKRLDPTEALTRTDLFVRYESKGEATLEKAHGGEATAEEVNANLRLETHTRFDTGEVTVDERPFEEFLTRTVEYRFVDWTVNDLLYEIQGTDSQRALRDLYDALPRIDRAEFNGDVAFETEDGGERERSFDVVLRDRMGQPLIVADINDARDPATDEMMADLVEGATAVGESHETLGAAFLVTSSFFEPGALETANEATGGGFLNRETKKSFVRLSRKQGYHLCLIEARGDAFHVAVPEL